MRTLVDVDMDLTSVLSPYGLNIKTYLETLENPPRLPPGTVDCKEYLRRIADLKQRLDQAHDEELERQMWEFTLLTRPIDGAAFRLRMIRLIRERCELVSEANTVEAERLSELEEVRRRSI